MINVRAIMVVSRLGVRIDMIVVSLARISTFARELVRWLELLSAKSA